MEKSGFAVVVLLRFSAIMMGLAVIAVFMPASWVEETHRWLGIGDFPEGPITFYLARSLSAFYVIYGGLLWLVSLDLERYYKVALYIIYAGLAFGPVVLFIDLSAGMPLYWTCFEGPLIALFSIVLLVLLRKSRG